MAATDETGSRCKTGAAPATVRPGRIRLRHRDNHCPYGGKVRCWHGQARRPACDERGGIALSWSIAGRRSDSRRQRHRCRCAVSFISPHSLFVPTECVYMSFSSKPLATLVALACAQVAVAKQPVTLDEVVVTASRGQDKVREL